MNRDINPVRLRAPLLILAVLMAGMVGLLIGQGRVGWCACGEGFWWAPDIWSLHNSQHLFDPYSFTHVLHGFLFGGLLAWTLKSVRWEWRLLTAVALESLWEVVENSAFIIQRYREATIGLGYEGDSITNSIADVLCCAVGFLLARALGWKRTLFWFVVIELFLLFWVRDNLSLNVLMLLFPIEAIKQWQMQPFLGR